jgi:hypothetical protein
MREIKTITGEIVIRSFFGTEIELTEINGKMPQVEIAELIEECIMYSISPIWILKS